MKTKHNNRALLLFLCVILTGSLISCSETAENADETAAGNTSLTPVTEETETETEADPLSLLEERDLGGLDFTFVGKSAAYGEWEMFEVNADEPTGEIMNDAVYDRNAAVAERFGIRVIGYKSGDPVGEFKRAVQAGTGDFGAGLLPVNDSTNLGRTGFLYDYRTVPEMDLSGVWFDQNANRSLEFGGKLFFSFGDMNLQNLDLTWCVMFNKQLVENDMLGDLYALPANDQWNLDKLFSLSADTSRDLDGNGVFNNKDEWGLVTPYNRTMLAFMYGCGVDFITIDAGGFPVYDGLSEKAFDVYGRVLSFYFEGTNALNVNTLSGQWRESETMFMNNQVLFYVECMQNLARFRDMEVDFGVLPMPKYTSEQEEYRHMVCDFPAATVLPSDMKDPETAGFVIEAINAASHRTVRTAYVDKCLMYKYSRDEESTDMVNLILDTMWYELAYIFGLGNLTSTIGNMAAAGQDNLASGLKSVEKIMKKDLDKLIGQYGG